MQRNSTLLDNKESTISIEAVPKENLIYVEYLNIALENDATTIGKGFPAIVQNSILYSRFTLNLQGNAN